MPQNFVAFVLLFIFFNTCTNGEAQTKNEPQTKDNVQSKDDDPEVADKDESVQAKRPNVLLIYLDDFGWKDAGFMGSDFYETPNLDKLASQGMVFSNAYSCSANCAPARASLLSGLYSPRHEVYNVGTAPRGKSAFRKLKHVPGVLTLDRKTKTFAHQLKDAGYATATMGKWHLSDDPIPYGFDLNIGGSLAGSPPKGYYPPHGKVPGLSRTPQGEYLTDRLSDEACKFIVANKAKPWFLYLTHFAVHTPLNAKKELVEKYRAKPPGTLHSNVKMATMIQAVDDGVGRIVQTLNENGLSKDTVIMFTSDNGGHGPSTDMKPLKGYKGNYYEGGIRVPFFVHWPNVVKKGSRSKVPVIGTDIYPTLCQMAGAELPSEVADGLSLVPLLKIGKVDKTSKLKTRSLFWHFPAYLESYRGVYDEQRDPLFRTRPCSIVRSGNWKLHHYYEDDVFELYNLADDIGETKNLADDKPKKLAELLKTLNDWREAVSAPIPNQRNDDYNAELEELEIKKRLAAPSKSSK